jgi:hypothetical protein
MVLICVERFVVRLGCHFLMVAIAPLAEEKFPAFWREARYVCIAQANFPMVLFPSLFLAA